MTDAPERIWLDADAEGEGQHTRCFGNPKYCSEPAIEYVRVVPDEDDAGDDARIAAASRQEWAERAWRAEAERDRLREALETISDASPLMMAVTCRDIARAALKEE